MGRCSERAVAATFTVARVARGAAHARDRRMLRKADDRSSVGEGSELTPRTGRAGQPAIKRGQANAESLRDGDIPGVVSGNAAANLPHARGKGLVRVELD